MVKTELKLKKAKRSRKFVKDKAIVNFLLEHMKHPKIDFSKIRVPSFINFLENEEKSSSDSRGFGTNHKANNFTISGNSSLKIFFEDPKK